MEQSFLGGKRVLKMNKLFFSVKLYRSKISTLGMIHRSETPYGELKLSSRGTESPGICFPPGESYMSLVSTLRCFPGCTPFPMVPCDGVYHGKGLYLGKALDFSSLGEARGMLSEGERL